MQIITGVCFQELRPTVPISGVPQEVNDLITNCWRSNPTVRLDATQIIGCLNQVFSLGKMIQSNFI
jgi:hypothetical protein